MQMRIIGRDSYPHSPFQARSSTRSGHVVKINCWHCYVGSKSTFPPPPRNLLIKLCKCGLLAVILIRTVLFKPVFLLDEAILLKSVRTKL